MHFITAISHTTGAMGRITKTSKRKTNPLYSESENVETMPLISGINRLVRVRLSFIGMCEMSIIRNAY